MATAAQVSANRENAQKSTGPRTEEGKARSSKNATRHGFNSKEFIVGENQQEEFASLSKSLCKQVSPLGALEQEVFTQLLHTAWKPSSPTPRSMGSSTGWPATTPASNAPSIVL